MCWSLGVYWTLSPKPTHDLSSLQHSEFMLLGEFRNYQISLFFVQGNTGAELNMDSACFKARGLKSEEGILSLKNTLSNKISKRPKRTATHYLHRRMS